MKTPVFVTLIAALSAAAPGTGPAGEVTLNSMIHGLELGMNPGDVIAVLGDDFTRVVSMMVEAEVWRYDFPTEPGYTFMVPSGEDEVDTEGLGNGSMRMQVFVVWNESGLLGDYTVFTGSENGIINEFRVFPDGSVRKSRL